MPPAKVGKKLKRTSGKVKGPIMELRLISQGKETGRLKHWNKGKVRGEKRGEKRDKAN